MKTYNSHPIVAFLKTSRVVICLTVFLFSWFWHYWQYVFWWPPVEAAWTTSKVDLVAILVDDAIYGWIKWDLDRYTNTYIPKSAPGTKSLVIPLSAQWFYPPDIQKLLANLYHEWQKWVSSQLVWVIVFWELPLPVVDLKWKRITSIYPYVDFEEPMFRYDPVSDVFVSNWHAESLPELWHSIIPTRDVGLFTKFFSKLKEYDASPTNYAKPMIWYDDFPMMKNSYSEEERERYLNTLIFAEANKEEQYMPTFSRLMNRQYEEDTVEAIKKATNEINGLQWPALTDEWVVWDPKAEEAVEWMFQWLNQVLERLDPKELEDNPIESGEKPIPTRLLEKSMQQDFKPNYTMFGNTYLTELQENVLAWWRYQLEDIDTSLEKVEITERVAKQFVTDMNLILEKWLDTKVEQEVYQLKYPLPYRYTKRKPWYHILNPNAWLSSSQAEIDALRESNNDKDKDGIFNHHDTNIDGDPFSNAWDSDDDNDGKPDLVDQDVFKNWCWMLRDDNNELVEVRYDIPFFEKVFGVWLGWWGLLAMPALKLRQWDFMWWILWGWVFRLQWLVQKFGKEVFEYARYENHYFWRNAVDITNYQDLTIYRWSFFNQLRIDELRSLAPTIREKDLEDIPWWKWSDASVWASAWWFAQQVQQNRAFNFNTNALDDKEIYDAMKCEEDQDLDQFAYQYWWGASPLNIDSDAFAKEIKYPITKASLTNRELAWNPSVDRQIWWPWYDPSWAILMKNEITKDKLHATAHRDFGSVIELWKEEKEARLMRASVWQYNSILDWKIDWCAERKQLNDESWKSSFDEIEYFYVYDQKKIKWNEWMWITVQPTIWAEEDLDDDRLPNNIDTDRDGDRAPDSVDFNALNWSLWTNTVNFAIQLKNPDGSISLGSTWDNDDTPLTLSGVNWVVLPWWDWIKQVSSIESIKTDTTRRWWLWSAGWIWWDFQPIWLSNEQLPTNQDDPEEKKEETPPKAWWCSWWSCWAGGWAWGAWAWWAGWAWAGWAWGAWAWWENNEQACVYDPLQLSSEQNIRLDWLSQSATLSNQFQKEYLVVDMSLHRCKDCVNSAIAFNSDPDFQARVSDYGSCDFVALTEDKTLTSWIDAIWGSNTFVWQRSWQNVSENWLYFNVPKLFWADPLTTTPTYYIINREWKVVVSREWKLPDLFYELCVPQCKADIPPPDEWQKQAAWWWGCNCGWGQKWPPKSDEEENKMTDITYEVPFNIIWRNVDGDRTANPNDRDMDGDGIANWLDRDTDGDGIVNISDPDVDNDGIANWLDPDIDQDALENRRDPDADADRVDDKYDDDIDADGIPNTQDPDSDADGEKDAEEKDSDKDGKDNAVDKGCGGCGWGCGGWWGWSCNGESRDVDWDQTPNDQDDDIDGDWILNQFDFDMDWDWLSNDEDADIDGDWIPNESDNDMDTDRLVNNQDDDRDSDGELNEFDETPNGYARPFSSPIALQLFGDNCVWDHMDIDNDWYRNDEDYDIDGDWRWNWEDPDMDGDWLTNGMDSDVDCDGKDNWVDDDTDMDGVPNSQEWEVDSDWQTNDVDLDIDGDGIPNGKDGDVDGDGTPNSLDSDIDGDQVPNHSDLDMDGDGIENKRDLDVDGDGLPNDMKINTWLDMRNENPNSSGNSDAANNDANQSSKNWGSCCGWKSGGCAGGCSKWWENQAGWQDSDTVDSDEDGVVDSVDGDDDNDWNPDSQDSDDDGDGYSDDQDSGSWPDTDSDGDGVLNWEDNDIDGDGVDNDMDTDDDGDGVPDKDDDDADADGKSDFSFPRNALKSKREDRWSICFMMWHDYRYQLINTTVKHTAPVIDETDTMSLMTLERPIDDSRYLAFHGIWWDVVEFIYPDLWNVPIYDCDLLKPDDIIEKINDYLKQKVQIYNQLLDIQLQKAPAHYAKHPAAFDFLETVDIAWTPNRSYDLLPETYFIDLLGEKEIKRLAYLLYAMSVGREQRPQAATIGEFIEKARDRFDRNKKQKYIIEEFLKYDDPEDEWKFDKIAYPTHIEKKYAYEVWYINSDWYDKIQRETDPLDRDLPAPPLPQFNSSSLEAGDKSYEWFTDQTNKSESDDSLCGVPSEKAVPVPRWPRAFSCWLEKTLEKPFDFDVKIEVDMKDRTTVDENGDVKMNEFWKSNLSIVTPIKSVPSPKRAVFIQNWTETKNIVPLWWVAFADFENQFIPQVIVDEKENAVAQITNNFSIGLSNQWLFTAWMWEDIFLALRMNENKWNISVSLRSEWSLCAQVEWKNLCTQALQLNSDFQWVWLRLPFSLLWNESGNGKLIATVCTSWTLCDTHEITYVQTPSKAINMSFIVPTDRIVRGGVLPIGIQTTDEFWNVFPFLPEWYVIVASGWSFVPDQTIEIFTLGWWEEWFTLFYPDKTSNSVSLSLYYADEQLWNKLLAEKKLQVVDWTWVVTDKEKKSVDYLWYRLPHKEIWFFQKAADGSSLIRNTIPWITISLEDKLLKNKIVTPVQVVAKQWLVRVWSVVDWGKRFVDNDTFLTNGTDSLFISLLPSWKAWKEYLEITAPWMSPYIIEFDVLPSGPDELKMNIVDGSLAVWTVTEFNVTIKDSRWNLYTEETEVDLAFWWWLELIATWGVDLLSWSKQEWKMKCVWWSCSGSCKAGSWWAAGASGKCGGWWISWWCAWWQCWWGWCSWWSCDWSTNWGEWQWWNNDWTTNGDGTDTWNQWWNDEWWLNDWAESNDPVADEAGWEEQQDEWWEWNNAASWVCIEKELETGKPPLSRYDQNETYGSFTTTIPETLWPSEPDQDINVMYLNLYGYPWWNESNTLQYLNNSKTLAITTFRQAWWESNAEEQLTALVHPDGKVDDIQWNMISEISVAWGTVSLQVWHQGWVWTIIYGTHPEFDMIQQWEEYGTRPHKIVYTPNKVDSILKSTSFEDGKIYYNDDVVVDIPRGYLDPRVHIRWSWAGNDRWVTLDNKQIWTLWIKRDGSIPYEKIVLHNWYRFEDTSPDASSASQQWIWVYVQSSLEEWSSGPLFESLEASYDSRKNIWMRHSFNAITNFSQWMRMWPATQQFWWPYMINYWDPFLQRVKENRLVQFTDYDSWPWKVVFSDTKSILDVDTGDLNKDGKTDLIISYKDWSVRILKNYWWWQPYKDLWFIMVIADWLKETFIGDVDGDGRDDIMVSTQSDKLRVYKNNNWEIAVDGTIVCLDIPNWDQNVAQVRQLFVDDMDGDKKLDIITNDINWDIKVFYWGSTSAWASYLSNDQFQCDQDRKWRQKQELVKSFSTKLWWPISDSSLRHWPELTLQDDTTSDDEEEGPESPVAEPDVKGMSKTQMKQFAKDVMTNKTKEVKEENDPKKLLKEWIKTLDARFEVPDVLRPDSFKWKPWFAWIPANDPLYPQTPRFDVQKSFTDLNGDVLEKWDLVKIDVSLIPVGTVWPVVYRERLDWPWVIYKDAFNAIPTFKKWSIPAWAEIDWNIWQWYQFMISNLPLWWTVNFSYEVQYDWNGYVNIEIETLKKEWFKWPTNQSLAEELFSKAHAGWWVKRIRAYPDESCWKEYWLFSPAEEKVQIDKFLKEKEKKYEEHFEETRKDLQEKATDPTTEDPLTKALGILPFLKNKSIEDWVKQIALQWVSGWWLNFELDADAYLQGEVEKAEQKVESITKEGAKWAMKFATLWLFPDDYEFTYNKCQWYKFGKKMCGPWSPIPFNTDLLSPWAFQVFGCKITDFKWLPIFAIPAAWIIPFWPINPAQVGWIFWGKVSQFRTYLTWTTSNWLWLSLCFWPYDTVKLPTPIGDVWGNCLVIAGNIGPQCTSVDDDKPVSPKQAITPKEAEPKMSLKPEQYAADKIWWCNEKEKKSSPFVSPTNGNKSMQIPGNVTENQSLNTQLRSNTRDSDRLGWYVGEWSATPADIFWWHGGDTFEVDYLKWWVWFQLKIEEGNVSGLVKCIFRKWKEKQIAYFANNALNMNISIILPDLEQMFNWREEWRHISDTPSFKKALNNWADEYKKTQASGVQWQNIIPEKTKITKLLPKWILKATSELIQNPFDHVIQFFEQVPLVTVEVRDVPLEVPLIYDEDAVRYAAYLESWVTRNEAILKERWTVDRVDQNALERMQQAVQNVKRNKNTLTQYKALPGKVYALLHASDQYIMTIFQFVDTFVAKLTWWLQDNAMRFSHWVDFIITLKWVIKTRQLLIDFTVNRQDKCSQCRQDHYDYYSCKLKLLCVDLPIIPIPSFRLPNITIDLSNISLWLDLIIPKFSVVPRKMNLFQIPDLPVPNGIALDLVIPTIPMLPPPPALPELPELDMELDMTLPVLPPAPKIPALSPSIKAVVKLMDVLGKFFCIFKWWIGLVREKFVKARVEQMTQRKWNIMPFDGIKIKLPTSPLQAYDYKVEAAVDVKFDFRVLYELARNVADDWNWFSNKSVNSVNKFIQGVWTWILEWVTDWVGGDIIDGAQKWIDGDIFIDLSDARSSDEINDYMVKERWEQRPRLLVWWPVPAVREFILDNARYMLDRQDVTWLHPQAKALIAEVSHDPQVNPNIAWVQEVWKQVSSFMETYADELKQTKQLVQNDWDWFLDSIQEKRLLSDWSFKQTFSVSLFNADRSFIDQLRATPHPMESYFAMNEVFVDWFLWSLERHHPEELNMNAIQHENLTSYLQWVKESTAFARSVLPNMVEKPQFARQEVAFTKQWSQENSIVDETINIDAPESVYPIHKTNTAWVSASQKLKKLPAPSLLAQADWWGGWESSSSTKVDFSQFIDGFFAPWKDWNYHNIIDREDKWNKRYDDQTYNVVDANDDWSLDIINYDEHQIFIKYWKQKDSYGWWWGGAVLVWPFSSAQDLEQRVKETFWWYSAGGEQFKVWSEENVYHEYSREWHTYNSMSFTWENDPRMDWYVLMLTDEQQTSEDKQRQSHDQWDSARTRYVVLLPEPISWTWVDLEIEDLLPATSLQSLKKSWKVTDVIYYDWQWKQMDVLLQRLERKWYYTKHAPLRLQKQKSGWLAWLLWWTEWVLKKVWPWSTQQVAGAQARWDDQIPRVDLELKRDLTWEIIARWPLMQWYINTTYTLKAKWSDNGKVVKNRVVWSGEVVQLQNGDEITIPGIDYDKPTEQQLLFVWIDQAGNQWQQEVRLQIAVPELKINEIRYLGVWGEIESELSSTIDRWKIRFERNRFGIWKSLQPAEFAVKPTDPVVVWWLYPFDDRIVLKDDQWKVIGMIDTKTGEITLNNWANADWNWWVNNDKNAWWNNMWWWNSSSAQVNAPNGKPQIEIFQTQWSNNQEKKIMTVTYTPKALAGKWVELLDDINYQLRDLWWWYLGDYREWYCLSPKWGECHIFVSRKWDVLIPAPRNALYKWTVSYDAWTIIYTFNDALWNPVVRVNFIIEPL
jgi:hypothetical protein